MLTPAKTWLFSAQYFESASLVVEYSNKEKIEKWTKILFPLVTVFIIALYLTYCGLDAENNLLLSEWLDPEIKVPIEKRHRWHKIALWSTYVCVVCGEVVNCAAIGLMVASICLIRRKVTAINKQRGTQFKVKLHEPVVAYHVLIITAISATYALVFDRKSIRQ